MANKSITELPSPKMVFKVSFLRYIIKANTHEKTFNVSRFGNSPNIGGYKNELKTSSYLGKKKSHTCGHIKIPLTLLLYFTEFLPSLPLTRTCSSISLLPSLIDCFILLSFSFSLSLYIYIYPTLLHVQDVIQRQFLMRSLTGLLSEFFLLRDRLPYQGQRSSSTQLFNNSWREISWIQTFPKSISAMCNTVSSMIWTRVAVSISHEIIITLLEKYSLISC